MWFGDAMNDDRPALSPVSAHAPKIGRPPPHTAILVLFVALAAFIAGLLMSPMREVSSVPSASIIASPDAFVPATMALPTSMTWSSPLPVGVYHVTQAQASQIAIAIRFYDAYNAGALETVMSILSAEPRLVDCDYDARATVTLAGRRPIATYLQARFADHDHWTVAFYQEDPANVDQVVVWPIERENDTLRQLGAPSGIKRTFSLLLAIRFNREATHLEYIQWGAPTGGSSSAAELCSP